MDVVSVWLSDEVAVTLPGLGLGSTLMCTSSFRLSCHALVYDIGGFGQALLAVRTKSAAPVGRFSRSR
jgi:hypothetical protein